MSIIGPTYNPTKEKQEQNKRVFTETKEFSQKQNRVQEYNHT